MKPLVLISLETLKEAAKWVFLKRELGLIRRICLCSPRRMRVIVAEFLAKVPKVGVAAHI